MHAWKLTQCLPVIYGSALGLKRAWYSNIYCIPQILLLIIDRQVQSTVVYQATLREPEYKASTAHTLHWPAEWHAPPTSAATSRPWGPLSSHHYPVQRKDSTGVPPCTLHSNLHRVMRGSNGHSNGSCSVQREERKNTFRSVGESCVHSMQ